MNIKGKKRSSLEKSHAHPLDLVLNSLLTFTYTFDKVHKVQKYFKGKCSPGVSYRRMLLIVINRISIAPPLSTVLSGISKKLQESNLAHHLLSRLNFQIQKHKCYSNIIWFLRQIVQKKEGRNNFMYIFFSWHGDLFHKNGGNNMKIGFYWNGWQSHVKVRLFLDISL